MMKLHQQKGVAAVELALILIPMLILCLGIIELGRALYQYEGVVKSTRGAARYLTQQNPNDPVTQAKAQSLAVCGKQTCTGGDPRLVPGLNDLSQVTVTTYPNVLTGAGAASLVSVRINDVKFNSVIPGGTIFLGWLASDGVISFPEVKVTMTYSTT